MHSTTDRAVYSTLGDDPDLAELVVLYVQEMPDRIAALDRQFASGAREELRRLAHQMKGASGSYGFHEITPLAARLENVVADSRPESEVLTALEALKELCLRVKAGAPASDCASSH